MAFRIKADESVTQAIRRMVRQQIGRALDRLDSQGDESASADQVVHDVRKRLKKVRAVIRLARGTLPGKLADRVAHQFRDAARPLSVVRDAEVLLATLDALAEHGGDWGLTDAFDAARGLLRQRRDEVERRLLDEADALAGLRATLHKARRDSGRWEMTRDGWEALAPGLGRIYRRGGRAFRLATEAPTDDNLHECRKRVKDLWYVLDLLGAVRPAYTEGRSALAHEIADLLGADHDLAVLQQVLTDPSVTPHSVADLALLLPLTRDRRAELQREALHRVERLYAERPRDFDARWRAYWDASRAEARAARFDRPGPSVDL